MNLVFEAASAIGNVGLSSGALADFSKFGQAIIVILMFIGRTTTLTLGAILFAPDRVGEAATRSSDIGI